MNNTARILLAIGAAIFLFMQLYFLFSGNFDDYLYSGYDWLPLPIILFFIPITILALLWYTIGQNEKSATVALVLAFASPLIIGPGFGFWLGKHEADHYEKYGVKTWGVVESAWGHRMYYYFNANGIQCMSANVNNRLGHSVGDTIEIIYNPKYPQMNSAIENL